MNVKLIAKKTVLALSSKTFLSIALITSMFKVIQYLLIVMFINQADASKMAWLIDDLSSTPFECTEGAKFSIESCEVRKKANIEVLHSEEFSKYIELLKNSPNRFDNNLLNVAVFNSKHSSDIFSATMDVHIKKIKTINDLSSVKKPYESTVEAINDVKSLQPEATEKLNTSMLLLVTPDFLIIYILMLIIRLGFRIKRETK